MQVSTIGLDLAKNVFQAHGVSAEGKVVLTKQLRRGQVLSAFAKLPPCLVGMEACAGAHYWARELRKLGHDVRLMPARDVKAYVKRDKTDAADAAAICEAVSRPSMRFVALKTPEQQGRLMQHRVRDLLLRQRTQTINALRAHMAELGLVAATGRQGLCLLLAILADAKDERLPQDARASLKLLASSAWVPSPSRATAICGASWSWERIPSLKQARARPDKHPWLARLMARKPGKLAAVALANKTARIAWAVLARGESYRAPTAPAAAG